MSARTRLVARALEQIEEFAPELAQAIWGEIEGVRRDCANYRGQLRRLQRQREEQVMIDLRVTVQVHHESLVALLGDLERIHDLPPEVAAFCRSIWPLLQAYGLRDHHGSTMSLADFPGRPVNDIRNGQPGDR